MASEFRQSKVLYVTALCVNYKMKAAAASDFIFSRNI